MKFYTEHKTSWSRIEYYDSLCGQGLVLVTLSNPHLSWWWWLPSQSVTLNILPLTSQIRGGSGFFIQKSAKSPSFPGTMGFDRITVISLGRKQELLWLVYSETFKILSHSHEEVGFPHLVGNHLSARLQWVSSCEMNLSQVDSFNQAGSN